MASALLVSVHAGSGVSRLQRGLRATLFVVLFSSPLKAVERGRDKVTLGQRVSLKVSLSVVSLPVTGKGNIVLNGKFQT